MVKILLFVAVYIAIVIFPLSILQDLLESTMPGQLLMGVVLGIAVLAPTMLLHWYGIKEQSHADESGD